LVRHRLICARYFSPIRSRLAFSFARYSSGFAAYRSRYCLFIRSLFFCCHAFVRARCLARFLSRHRLFAARHKTFWTSVRRW